MIQTLQSNALPEPAPAPSHGGWITVPCTGNHLYRALFPEADAALNSPKLGDGDRKLLLKHGLAGRQHLMNVGEAERYRNAVEIFKKVLTAEWKRRPPHSPKPPPTLFDYCRDFASRWTSDHRQLVEGVSTQLGPLSKECIVSVGIPIAATEEHQHIKRCLTVLGRQSLHPDLFEVTLLLNRGLRDTYHSRSLAAVERTEREIEAFVHDHPWVNLRVARITFPNNRFRNVGYLRSVLGDCVVHRKLQSCPDSETFKSDALYLVRMDADTIRMHREHLSTVIKKLDDHPQAAAVSRFSNWDLGVAIDDPKLFVIAQGQNLLFNGSTRSPIRGCPNFAVKLSAYVAAGGYHEQLGTGEDLDFGGSLLRGASKSMYPEGIIRGGFKMALETSARRLISAVTAGFVSDDQWCRPDQPFGADNEEIRVYGDDATFCGLLEYTESALLRQLETIVNTELASVEKWHLQSGGNANSWERLSRRYLRYFGFDYSKAADGRVELKGYGRFLDVWNEVRVQQADRDDRFDRVASGLETLPHLGTIDD